MIWSNFKTLGKKTPPKQPKPQQELAKAKQPKLKSFSVPRALITKEIMHFPWRPTNIFVQNPGLQFDLLLTCSV